MAPETDKAVILARGLGSRMRRHSSAKLTPAQHSAAEQGLKGMFPIKRPFLDYLLTVLANAGYRQVCLVIGPEHEEIRKYYSNIKLRRLKIAFAIQANAKGTADAVAAAQNFVDNTYFLALNSDNYYPLQPCADLRTLTGPGVASFDRLALTKLGNIPAERIERFAILQETNQGYLQHVIEKPTAEALQCITGPIGVSMNCWKLPPTIFAACQEIGLSPRGEYELTDAVNHLIKSRGARFQVLRYQAPVLDLSSREDIPAVTQQLENLEVDI